MTACRATVLLVDDNEDNRLIYRAMLKHHGYRVLAASDGETAIRAARRLNPDIILMDIDLPGIDGWTAIEILRSAPDTGDVPVLALTARDSAEDRARAEELGCRRYLLKPCSPLDVAAEVAIALDQRRASAVVERTRGVA